MTSPTIGDMIAKYAELKAFVEAEDEVHKERMKPYRDALFALQTACGVHLSEQGLQNFKSDDGTAYLKHSDGLKLDSQADFLNFVRVNERWDMASVGLLVDPVRDYLAKHDALPPGVTSSPSVTCIIRR